MHRQNIPGTNDFTYGFVQPTTIYFGQIRVDHNFSSADSLALLRYTVQDPQNTNTNFYPQVGIQSFGRDQFLTLSEQHIFSPTVLNVFRVHYSKTNLGETELVDGLACPTMTPTCATPLTSAALSFVPGDPMGNTAIGGITSFNTTNAPYRLLQRYLYLE